MPKESQIMSSVSSVLNYIKSQIAADLLAAKQSNTLDLEVEQIEKISRIVQTSIESNFGKSCDEIIKACQE